MGRISGSPDDVRMLREKIHSYVSFALDGPLVEAFPNATDRPVRIHLGCQPPLAAPVQATLERLEPAVLRSALDLSWGAS